MWRAVVLAGALLLTLAADAAAGELRAGVGKADITPKTGYYLGGWTRADRTAQGQHTRLHSRALVLERDGRKVALVAADLFMVSGGLVKHVADRLAARGFGEGNILISASHTHSGPGGFANYKTFNTTAPSLETVTDPGSFFALLNAPPADRQLYTFLVERIATAIARADDDLAPARAAWGSARLTGLTRNRSVEAHLANHGIVRRPGQGSAELDPAGAEHTIDPNVRVLRVDKVVGGRRIPIGGWSNFANHGTVTKSSFEFYNQDHHGSAIAMFERGVREEGGVPAGQQVLNVYGNGNEGDQSAGLDRHGPAASDYVGRVEAAAMLRAWRAAEPALSGTPTLDLRWTRACFCGQTTEGGPVNSSPEIGLPFLTGSEEERGPLYDITRHHFEGTRDELGFDSHGHKLGIPLNQADVPKAVPLMAVRVGDGAIVSLPGEPTAEVGARTREAVLRATAGSGVRHAVVAGLANEFIQYITTPQEYDRQHYEGGSSLYGRLEGNFLRDRLAELAGRLVRGEPAPPAYGLDPTNGVAPDGAPYGSGATAGEIAAQPTPAVPRLGHATIAWRGGPDGLDRPLDRGFVLVERRVGGAWREVTSDLGLEILWTVDAEGNHTAKWEVPLDAATGVYRLVVAANRYRLTSSEFRVEPSGALSVRKVGPTAVTLDYPAAVRDRDLTWRPPSADGGTVTFVVGSRRVTVRRSSGTVFEVDAPPGAPVSVDSARDLHGNVAAGGIRLR
jgi:neutral ceramidase